MAWKDSDFIMKSFCIARSSYQNESNLAKRIEKELREAYRYALNKE